MPEQGCSEGCSGTFLLGTGALHPRAAGTAPPGQREDRQTLTGNKLIKHLSPHLRLPQHYKAHFLPEAFLSRFLLPGP